MYKKLFHKVRGNLAFFIMLGSSFCTFLAIIFIKKVTTSEVFALYTLLQIYVGYLFTLSFFSSDSVLLRYAKIIEGKIYIPRRIYKQCLYSYLAAFVLLPLIGLVVLEISAFEYIALISLFIAVSLLFLFSILLRLRSEFFMSQLSLNLWKVIAPLILFLYYTLGFVIGEFVIVIALIFSLFVTLSLVAILRFKKMKDLVQITSNDLEPDDTKNLQFSYLISFVFFAILGSFDRVVLQYNQEIDVYTSYLYFISIMLFPIGIIASYVGYKELILIKNGKKINLLTSSITVSLYSSVLFLFYSAFIYFIKENIELVFDFYLWLAVFLIILCKVPYSIFSAVIGAKGKAKDILHMNLYFLCGLALVVGYTYYFGGIYSAIYFVALIWLLRTFFFYKKSIKYAQ